MQISQAMHLINDNVIEVEIDDTLISTYFYLQKKTTVSDLIFIESCSIVQNLLYVVNF